MQNLNNAEPKSYVHEETPTMHKYTNKLYILSI